MLDVKSAAKRLGVSKSLCYLLIERGLLGCYRIGTGRRGILRVTEAQIEAYLETRRQDAVHQPLPAAGDHARQD
jgi:excisionase family DNA binding protein